MRRVLLLAALIAAACNDADDAVARSGSCCADTGTATGSGDGGADAGAAVPGPGCFQHVDCPARQVCLAAACEPMFDRPYAITISQLGIRERDDLPWDTDGNPPDPYVQAVVDGQVVARTATLTDTWLGAWAEPLVVPLRADSELILGVLDDDEDEPEVIEQIIIHRLADTIRQGGFSGMVENGEVTSISLGFQPRPE